jgi:hypothetical protein
LQRGSISSDSTATIQYDELERVIERTDGCGKLIEKVVFDENGNQVAVYITEGSTTEQTASYSYDLLKG